MKRTKACFLDRDGVLIEEKNYLSSPADVHIFEETYQALKLLQAQGYLIIVVTNQGGVGRGYYKESDIHNVHKEIDRLLTERNLKIDAYYYCPHYPGGRIQEYAVKCDCRKPSPGMLIKAAADFDIDMKKSFMVGDKVSDIEAAVSAGCDGILVKTGHGAKHAEKAQKRGYAVKDNILDAVQYFFEQNRIR